MADSKQVRDDVAKIINPYAFMPDNSGDDLVASIVREDMAHAFRQADRIIDLLSKRSALIPDEPKRAVLDIRLPKYGTCQQCGTHNNLGKTEDGSMICGSCADGNYLADWIDYARALRRNLTAIAEPK